MTEYSLIVRLLCEFMGTAIMVIIGNGSVANVELKGSKGYHSGWSVIAVGYGLGVMVPAMAFGHVTAQINPAFTVGLAVWGQFPWHLVPAYVCAQLLGAMAGQFGLFVTHKPYYDRTENPESILGTCSTINAAHSWVNGFFNEFLGTLILVSCALSILNSPNFAHTPGTAAIGVGFLVWALVAGLGGPTGPALNPARDLGPRIMHAIFPFPHKGSSQWEYAWVPVVAPICGGIAGVAGWYYLLGTLLD